MDIDNLIIELTKIREQYGNLPICTTNNDGDYCAYIDRVSCQKYWYFEEDGDDIVLLGAGW